VPAHTFCTLCSGCQETSPSSGTMQAAQLANLLQEAACAADGDWTMIDITLVLSKFEAETSRKTLFSIAFF
jgi:hypothetical protein